MDKKAILARVDHTILKPEATWLEVKTVCDEARDGHCASVCLPPCHVAQAAEYLQGSIPICTVVGFPHGNVDAAVKAYEASRALQNGATEIDMVLCLGKVKSAAWDEVADELCVLRSATQGATLKVIIEACLLTQAEKVKLCALISAAGADFIKTSTGFSSGGATCEDVALFRAHIAPDLRIKAAGGIRSFEAAQDFIHAGADRIGSSALYGLWKQETT